MYTPLPPQFYLFPKRKNSQQAFASIYIKVFFEQKLHEKNTGVVCPFDKWDGEKMIISDYPVETYQLNTFFEQYRQKITGAYYMLLGQTPDFALQDILDMASGERKPAVFSFTGCFKETITRMEKLKGADGNSATNIQKHKRCLEHLQSFLHAFHKTSDIAFGKINRTTIDELSQYLRSEGSCSHNTAMKYLQIIKKIYRIGMDNGWVKVNAFANFKFKIKIQERDCLTEEELQRLMNRTFEIERLNNVKDMFVFSCFTGLAYIDVKTLRRRNIVFDNGSHWIKNKRVKTGIQSSLPLLEPAKRIIDKYCPGWYANEIDRRLFNVISNQKLNAYLKEIADICNIDKEITFHLARHTFATTVALCNDVPMETVSKMLGHTRITMTQHYSKVIDGKITKDTEILRSKFK